MCFNYYGTESNQTVIFLRIIFVYKIYLFFSHRNNKNRSEETLEVVCRIKNYHGENPCVLAQDENYVKIVSPVLSNRFGEPVVRIKYFISFCITVNYMKLKLVYNL